MQLAQYHWGSSTFRLGVLVRSLVDFLSGGTVKDGAVRGVATYFEAVNRVERVSVSRNMCHC